MHQARLWQVALGESIQIDDATGVLMYLRVVRSKSTESYFAALTDHWHEHGLPVAFYSGKHSVFRVNKTEVRSGHGMTQFGRALSELNIETSAPIAARPSIDEPAS